MVSVIIPNYNHFDYLQQRINSVLAQVYQDIEIIILDDCSTDNSREVIESYRTNKNITHIIYNQTNSGSPFIQWKKGIELAKGKYIWIAESDDYADVTFLEKVMTEIEKDPEISICYAASNIIENEKVNKANRNSLYYNKLFNTTRWSESFINDGKQELINYMGGFCTIINASSCVFLKSAFPKNKDLYTFKYCGDWLVWMEMCLKGKVAYINEPLNYFRIHAKSTFNAFSTIKKAKEFYHCLLRAKSLTNGQSIIPDETLEIAFHIWTYNSLYFFLKNFRLSLFTMHCRLDKNIRNKIISLFKNYYRMKLNKV